MRSGDVPGGIGPSGDARGWLLQAWQVINRTWPHGKNRLRNNGKMATGPEGFFECLNHHVPLGTDVVILAFADMCFRNWDQVDGRARCITSARARKVAGPPRASWRWTRKPL